MLISNRILTFCQSRLSPQNERRSRKREAGVGGGVVVVVKKEEKTWLFCG